MDARVAIGLAMDRDVRRAALRAFPPMARLGLAVSRHLARRQAAELGLGGSDRARRRRRRVGLGLLGSGALAAAGVALADPQRRRDLTALLGVRSRPRFGAG